MDSEQRPLKRRKLDVSENIRITVQRNDKAPTKTFTIQRCLLESSDFFVVCLKGDWAENNNKAIELKETDPDVFEAYAGWLFTKELVDDGKTQKDVVSSEQQRIALSSAELRRHCSKRVTRFTFYAKCFILGDKLQDMAFRNASMDKMRAENRDDWKIGWLLHMAPRVICMVYQHLPEGSALRRYTRFKAKLYDKWTKDKKYVQKKVDEMPQDWTVDGLWSRGQEITPGSKEALFHEHGDKVPEAECAVYRAWEQKNAEK